MSRLILIFAGFMGFVAPPVAAQDLSALARATNDNSFVIDRPDAVNFELSLSQAVPYRIFTVDEPRRLVIDFNEVNWESFKPEDFDNSALITDVRVGIFVPGWSRMVLDLAEPLGIKFAEISTGTHDAKLKIELEPIGAEAFSENAGTPAAAKNRVMASEPASQHQRQNGVDPLVVILDPGHGGIDPGAQADGATEADLMLTFALELREALLRNGQFQVVLTREANVFVPLESRISIAREAGGDVFLSLHADALVEGRASGSTVYTLSEGASDIAAQKLAERHDRSDLLAGIDLAQQGDAIAIVLMDMARTETAPRSHSLAEALVEGLGLTVGVHKRPHLSAGFSVLKSPDIPSVLIELGFLSSKADREKLLDPEWRVRAIEGLQQALLAWRITDAAQAEKVRR